MDIKELRNLDNKVLLDEIASLRKEMLNLKLNSSSTQVKDSSQFSKIRKRVARAKTILQERSIQEGNK